MTTAQAKQDLADVRSGRVPVSEVRRARIEELAALRDDPSQHDEAVQRIHALVTVSRDEINFTEQGNPQVSRQYITPEGNYRFETTSDLGMVTQTDNTPAEVEVMGLNASNKWGTEVAYNFDGIRDLNDFAEAVQELAGDHYSLRQLKAAKPQLWDAYANGQSDEFGLVMRRAAGIS